MFDPGIVALQASSGFSGVGEWRDRKGEREYMARTVAVGVQDFSKVIEEHCFYVDKTDFIKEWWEYKDDVTLITRPRRFGKTLTMSMLEYFFRSDMQGGAVYLKT